LGGIADYEPNPTRTTQMERESSFPPGHPVPVNIQKSPDCLCMKIQDDGKSFDVNRALHCAQKTLGLTKITDMGKRPGN
jgi:hypothetical protein